MKSPKRIQPLIEEGLVDEVISQLMSGKEATVYIVRCGSEIRCAKVYKEATKRSFKKAVQYREGRKGHNSRRNRAIVMRYILRMLCAGVVHGDLSEFNVLLDDHGPVIIDLPQAVDAAGNNNARAMLERDVNNMTAYYGRYAPKLLSTNYAREIWALYEAGELHPEVELSGQFEESTEAADVDLVMLEIKAAFAEEQERMGLAEGF